MSGSNKIVTRDQMPHLENIFPTKAGSSNYTKVMKLRTFA